MVFRGGSGGVPLQSPASVPPVETLVNPPFSLAENLLQFTLSETSLSNSK